MKNSLAFLVICLLDFLLYSVVRYVIFSAIWLLTAGRHHFWLLPNLTEECGVLESFVPLYAYSYNGDSNKEDEGKEDDKENGKDNEG